MTASAVDVVYTVVPVSAGSCLGNPFTVTVTVNPEPIVVSQLATVCSDVATGVTLGNDANTPAVATYNIVSINSNGLVASAGTPVTGTGKLANEIVNDAWTNTTALSVNVIYTVVPVSAAGCQGNPFTVTMIVNPEPVVANQSIVICSDADLGVNYNPSTSVTAATYNITDIQLSGLTPGPDNDGITNGLLPGDLNDDAFTNLNAVSASVLYTVNPVSPLGCVGEMFAIVVSVNPEPIVANQSLTVCSDEVTAHTFANDIDTPQATTFNVTAINANGLTASAGTPVTGTGKLANEIANDAWTNNTAAPVNVIYTVVPVSAAGCAGDAFTVTVTVSPEPVVVAQTATVCSDVASGVTLGTDANTPTVALYNIISINSNGLTASAGSPVSGVNGIGKSNTELINDAWTNTTPLPVDVVYTIVPVATTTGCLGDPFTVTLTINPEPVVASQTLLVCSDAASALTLNNDVNTPSVATYNVLSITNANLNTSGVLGPS
jgi:hypothetical protein